MPRIELRKGCQHYEHFNPKVLTYPQLARRCILDDKGLALPKITDENWVQTVSRMVGVCNRRSFIKGPARAADHIIVAVTSDNAFSIIALRCDGMYKPSGPRAVEPNT